MVFDNLNQTQLEAIAAQIADKIEVSDSIFFLGDLGVGKSTFIRALIRTRAKQPDLIVPSPTFTLIQPYPQSDLILYHFDLYRLQNIDELQELGIDEMLKNGALLVEWPQLLQQANYYANLNVKIEELGDGQRKIILAGDTKFLHH